MTNQKVNRYDWLPLDVAPQLRVVPIAKLKVDHTYQRAQIFKTSTLAIARDFDWAKFGALSVVDRDGELYVTDGQQRLAAVKSRGDIDRVPCVVTKSTGVEHEAASFIGINTNRKCVSANDKYTAALASGDPLHVMVNQMLEAQGLRVGTGNETNVIQFAAMLIRTARIDIEHCGRCLALQRQAVGPDVCMHNYIHKGLFLIATHQTAGNIYDHGESMYRRGGMPVLLNAIKAASIQGGMAGVSDKSAAMGILAVVNKSLRSNKVQM